MAKIILKDKVKEIKHCRSLLSKVKGLMFTLPKDRALVFYFKNNAKIDLHMFFVFYAIDAYWLDDKKEVIEAKKKFIPFTISRPVKASYIIEARSGLLALNKGDVVDF